MFDQFLDDWYSITTIYKLRYQYCTYYSQLEYQFQADVIPYNYMDILLLWTTRIDFYIKVGLDKMVPIFYLYVEAFSLSWGKTLYKYIYWYGYCDFPTIKVFFTMPHVCSISSLSWVIDSAALLVLITTCRQAILFKLIGYSICKHLFHIFG